MKILVTGCVGFIGSHLCEALLSRGHTVIGVDNINSYYDRTQKLANLKILSSNNNFIFFECDVIDTKIITTTLNQIDVICHLAAMAGVRSSLEDPAHYSRVNIEGFINLLEEARKNKITKIVYASSSSVYGLNSKTPFEETDSIDLPNSPYAVSKKCMEIYADFYNRVYNMSLIGLRFFTVYGPRGRPDMAPYKFLRAILEGTEIIKYGNGTSYRDYTYVSDIVQGILGAIDLCCSINKTTNKPINRVYNLGNGNPITLNKFIETCEKVTGKNAKIKQIEDQVGDVPGTFADISRAKEDLGYQPRVILEEGLSNTKDWLLSLSISSTSNSIDLH